MKNCRDCEYCALYSKLYKNNKFITNYYYCCHPEVNGDDQFNIIDVDEIPKECPKSGEFKWI